MQRYTAQQTRRATMRGLDVSPAAVRTGDASLSFIPGTSLWTEGHKANETRGRT